ncbi:MAG: hypothetical protein ABIT71_12970 [Vicinamibacteraceae bacterium]
MVARSVARVTIGAVVAVFALAPAGARPEAAARTAPGLPGTTMLVAPACAATPQDAWTLAQTAVASGDAGLVTERLSPDYRARNALEMAIGASMMAEISGLSGEGSGSPAKAAAAKAAETKLLAELDALLRKYKAPTVKEIGTPLMMKMNDPATQAKFAPVDHVALAREMETFFRKVEAAAAAAGVKGESTKLDELVVGYGDLKTPPAGVKVTGDTATLPSGKVTMRFKKIGGCWLVDGRD